MFRFLKKEKVLPEKIVWKMPEPQPPRSARRFRKKKREQGN